MLWGISTSLDLLTQLEKVTSLFGQKEINVLLMGSTDARHILKTMSALRRHPVDAATINFFVMDLAPDLVARQLLLLTVALEPEEILGLQEKARLWMEVYGNTLLRPVTARYVMSKAVQLIRMVTDSGFLSKRMPLVSLEHVKYKEIDQLENIFKFWVKNRTSIVKIWDIKLRKSLGTRYDCRLGVFDWDYNMKLHEIEGGQRVCAPEYKMWRNTGIAFTWLETEFSVGNPTLAVGIGCSGDELFSHGYMGDMESGPYFAFGTTSEERKMLEVRDGHNTRRATDITERNLQRMLYELEHGSPPTDEYSASLDLGLVIMKPGNVDVEKDVGIEYEPPRAPEEYTAIAVPNCRVYFLPGNAMELYPKKAKYKEFFNVVYVAQNFFKFLNADIMSMAKPNGCLIVETRKFVISLHKEIGQFGKEVRTKLKEIGWEEVTKCHFCRDDHALCRKSPECPRQAQKELSNLEEPDDEEDSEVAKGVEVNKGGDTVKKEEKGLDRGECGEKVLETAEESVDEWEARDEKQARLKAMGTLSVINDTESTAKSKDLKITGDEGKNVLIEEEETANDVISSSHQKLDLET